MRAETGRAGDRVTVRAAAKINLHLGVGARRPDGFHPLVTVYQAIGLYDDVTATPVAPGAGWSVRTTAEADVDLDTLADDDSHLALRAGRLLAAHHGVEAAAHLEVRKEIPVAGGMAGGSADAAAALVALDRLWELETSDDDLLALAAELGSDVPFALLGGTALGTGRGELVAPIEDRVDLWWVVVPHEIGLPTPAVYRAFDRLAARAGPSPSVDTASAETASAAGLVDALAAGDAARTLARLHNDLAAPAYALRPDLAERAALLADAAGRPEQPVLLSGSGPTQLLPFTDVERARAVVRALTERGIAHRLAPGPVAGAHVVVEHG